MNFDEAVIAAKEKCPVGMTIYEIVRAIPKYPDYREDLLDQHWYAKYDTTAVPKVYDGDLTGQASAEVVLGKVSL
jgi:hypothetical protein